MVTTVLLVAMTVVLLMVMVTSHSTSLLCFEDFRR